MSCTIPLPPFPSLFPTDLSCPAGVIQTAAGGDVLQLLWQHSWHLVRDRQHGRLQKPATETAVWPSWGLSGRENSVMCTGGGGEERVSKLHVATYPTLNVECTYLGTVDHRWLGVGIPAVPCMCLCTACTHTHTHTHSINQCT